MGLAVGDAARREDGTLGVVCRVYRHGNVNLLLEDGSITGSITVAGGGGGVRGIGRGAIRSRSQKT